MFRAIYLRIINQIGVVFATASLFTVFLCWIFSPGYLDINTNSVFYQSIVHGDFLRTMHSPAFFLVWRGIYAFTLNSSLSMYIFVIFLFNIGLALLCRQIISHSFGRVALHAIVVFFPSNLVLLTIIQKELFMQAWAMIFISCILMIQSYRQKVWRGAAIGVAMLALFFILNARPDSFSVVIVFIMWLLYSCKPSKNKWVFIQRLGISLFLTAILGATSMIIEHSNKAIHVYDSVHLAMSDIGAFSVEQKQDFLYEYTPQYIRGDNAVSSRKQHLDYISKKYIGNRYYFIDELLWRGPVFWRLDALLFDSSMQSQFLRHSLFMHYFSVALCDFNFLAERHTDLWWFMVTKSAYWVKQLGFEQPVAINHENSDFWDISQTFMPRRVNESSLQWRLANKYIQFFPENPFYTLISYFIISMAFLMTSLVYLKRCKSDNRHLLNAGVLLFAGIIYISCRWIFIINPSYRYGQFIVLTTIIGGIFFIKGLFPASSE